MKKGILIVLMMFAGLCFADDKIAEVRTGELWRISFEKTGEPFSGTVTGIYPLSSLASGNPYMLELNGYKIVVKKGDEFYSVYVDKSLKGCVTTVHKFTITDVKPNVIYFSFREIETLDYNIYDKH